MQGSLFDIVPESRFWESILNTAKKRAKKTLPYQLDGETKEEYDQNLKDETRLEIVNILRNIADDLEKQTLERQKHTIDILYDKGVYDD